MLIITTGVAVFMVLFRSAGREPSIAYYASVVQLWVIYEFEKDVRSFPPSCQ